MLSPKDCNQATAREAVEFKAAEKHIDGELAAKYLPGERVVVTPPKVGGRVMLRLLEAYRQAGWTVRHSDDQRDGDYYLEFTAAPDAADYYAK